MAERPAVAEAVSAAARRGRLSVIAALVRLTGDFDLAEDCWQDAVERALAQWPADGIPGRPEAWLSVAARNRAFDALRRRRTQRDKLPEVYAMTEPICPQAGEPASAYDDDRLKLLFACCHPALSMPSRVALTLKTVTGLSTREVARAFLVSEATMSQRLLRTKTKIAHAGIAPPLAAFRADLLRRAGRHAEAAAAYRDAIGRARTEAERRFLRRRLSEILGAS